MAEPAYDFVIFGSTPLACLLAGLLANGHGRSVCVVGTVWSPFHLQRPFELSVLPATRPETWAMLQRGKAETLKLLRSIGKGLYERVDPVFVAETPASIDMLGHMRHVALGLALVADRVTDRGLVGSGSGCRIGDAAALVPGRIEPALVGWLEGHGVDRFDSTEITVALRRDGSALLGIGDQQREARHAILADDAAILQHLEALVRGPALRVRDVTSVLTAAAPALAAPFIDYLDRGVMLGQRAGKGGITATVEGSADVLPRLGSCLAALGPQSRAGQTASRGVATADGAPAVGTLSGSRATIVAGLGTAGAFLAPALARFIAGVPTDAEHSYFTARAPARGASRQKVGDWTNPMPAEQPA